MIIKIKKGVEMKTYMTVVVDGNNYDFGGRLVSDGGNVISCPCCGKHIRLEAVQPGSCEIFKLPDYLLILKSKSPQIFFAVIAEVNKKIVDEELEKIEREQGCTKCRRNMSCDCSEMQDFQF